MPGVGVREPGLLPGFSQVRWLLRACNSVVNCLAVSPVIGRYGNGSSGLA